MTAKFTDSFRSDGLSWRLQVVAFLLAACAIVSRRPDVLSNPQFWAEDGRLWFEQAYNLGWLHALVVPSAGYLSTVPRLVAGVCLLVPLRFAPLVMNCVGLTLQALPVNVMLSSHCSSWGSLSVRMLYSATYLALPNSPDINVSLTDAHFHLALTAFLLAMCLPPVNWQWRAFDLAVFSLSCLTGPWALFFLPLILIFWWIRRSRWSLWMAAIAALCTVTQSLILLNATGTSGRAGVNLGATPMLFLRIVAGNVFAGAFGQSYFGTHGSHLAIGITVVLGSALLLFALLKAGLRLKLFIVFSFSLLAASLRSPLISGPSGQWKALLTDLGIRYWFFPTLAFVWCLIWCASESRIRAFQVLAIAALCLTLPGVIRDWKYQPLEDEHFTEYVRQFNAIPHGTLMTIPINPPGWTIKLRRR